MKIQEIAHLLHSQPNHLSPLPTHEFRYAFASDLMSDVLTVEVENLVLITGLMNVQTIRTAEVSDIRCIIFVRNKPVSEEIETLAKETGITILSSPFSMFKTCGLLYQSGLDPVY